MTLCRARRALGPKQRASPHDVGGRVEVGYLRVPWSPRSVGGCSMPESPWTREETRMAHVG